MKSTDKANRQALADRVVAAPGARLTIYYILWEDEYEKSDWPAARGMGGGV